MKGSTESKLLGVSGFPVKTHLKLYFLHIVKRWVISNFLGKVSLSGSHTVNRWVILNSVPNFSWSGSRHTGSYASESGIHVFISDSLRLSNAQAPPTAGRSFRHSSALQYFMQPGDISMDSRVWIAARLPPYSPFIHSLECFDMFYCL